MNSYPTFRTGRLPKWKQLSSSYHGCIVKMPGTAEITLYLIYMFCFNANSCTTYRVTEFQQSHWTRAQIALPGESFTDAPLPAETCAAVSESVNWKNSNASEMEGSARPTPRLSPLPPPSRLQKQSRLREEPGGDCSGPELTWGNEWGF